VRHKEKKERKRKKKKRKNQRKKEKRKREKEKKYPKGIQPSVGLIKLIATPIGVLILASQVILTLRKKSKPFIRVKFFIMPLFRGVAGLVTAVNLTCFPWCGTICLGRTETSHESAYFFGI
jgi:hypothetical protein